MIYISLVLILVPPKPKSREIEQFGFTIGQPGKVIVTFHANPLPSIEWLVDNHRIQEGARDPSGRFHALVLVNKVSRHMLLKERALTGKLEVANNMLDDSKGIFASFSNEIKVRR